LIQKIHFWYARASSGAKLSVYPTCRPALTQRQPYFYDILRQCTFASIIIRL